ncbi:TetR/AcrR family transcriptional regulator [Streptomyces boninensis]|uniref:TetR/AcrR family transcriptional regulator n=1 Tax=Streptomyces boninensis TaxID=2039455 RepID=UPI003B21167C
MDTVWTRPERGARGPAPEHSRAQLTAVAIELADADGLAAVSMRRVAGQLGTGPASLYRYVAGRDDLIDLMSDAVAGEIDLGVPLTGDPVDDLVALAVRTKDVQLRHPWVLDVPPEPLRLGPRGLDYLEHTLRALAPSPLSGQAKLEAIGLLSAQVTIFARTELQGRQAASGRRAAQAAYLAQAAAAGHHPTLAATMADAAEAPPVEDLFERLVRRVLTGLLG